MIKKIKDILFLSTFLFFLSLILIQYFSEEHIISANKSRAFYSSNFSEFSKNLPILKNDTNNIIVYKDDLQNFKKKSKKRFWEKLISE